MNLLGKAADYYEKTREQVGGGTDFILFLVALRSQSVSVLLYAVIHKLLVLPPTSVLGPFVGEREHAPQNNNQPDAEGHSAPPTTIVAPFVKPPSYWVVFNSVL